VSEHQEHIVSPKIYLTILIALLIGTVVTVYAAKIDLGRWNIVLALTIAVIKMTLVILFFMHGKYSARRTKLIIASGFFWLAIMLVLTLGLSMLTFASGRSNVLLGAVHLVLFLAYLVLIFER